jgi:hypothetical protein
MTAPVLALVGLDAPPGDIDALAGRLASSSPTVIGASADPATGRGRY